jgi:hypothetical protein
VGEKMCMTGVNECSQHSIKSKQEEQNAGCSSAW